MNTTVEAILLLAVPGMPLAMAIPNVRAKVSWPGHLALLPALVLLILPSSISVELPWWLLGGGLTADGGSRVLLGAAVLLWAGAATLLYRPASRPVPGNRVSTLFLLTMAGHLGAILTTDMVVFFAFSTLMGYGFLGLMIAGGSPTAQRAGRIYLVFLVLADLALFEALLVAAAMTGTPLAGNTVSGTIQPVTDGFYLGLVFVGFALRTGIWPVHIWLPMAFRGMRPELAFLIGTVPVSTGLLGLIRWLPLGDTAWVGAGWLISGLGMAAILHALLIKALRRQQLSTLTTVTLCTTGMVTLATGACLTTPEIWTHYSHLAPYFIMMPGITAATLQLLPGWTNVRHRETVYHTMPADESEPWWEKLARTALRRGAQMGKTTLPHWRDAWLARATNFWHADRWRNLLDRGERSLQRWPLAMTLFLILGMLLVFSVIGS